jgi:hypothetical protein
MEKTFYDIGDLTEIAFYEDTRVLAAFAAIITPPDGELFGLDVVLALKSLDWRNLLIIAFKRPLDVRQSTEFLDTMENLCDIAQQNDIASFINTKISNSIDLIHPESRDRFKVILSNISNSLFEQINKNIDR